MAISIKERKENIKRIVKNIKQYKDMSLLTLEAMNKNSISFHNFMMDTSDMFSDFFEKCSEDTSLESKIQSLILDEDDVDDYNSVLDSISEGFKYASESIISESNSIDNELKKNLQENATRMQEFFQEYLDNALSKISIEQKEIDKLE